jgi:hypothetical protein
MWMYKKNGIEISIKIKFYNELIFNYVVDVRFLSDLYVSISTSAL